jgi:hypothetical protein
MCPMSLSYGPWHEPSDARPLRRRGGRSVTGPVSPCGSMNIALSHVRTAGTHRRCGVGFLNWHCSAVVQGTSVGGKKE